MFLSALLFALLALLSFAVIMLVTRPSAVERAVEHRIARLRDSLDGALAPVEVQDSLIKPTQLSGIASVDHALQRFRWAHRLQRLIEQSESRWSVPKVLSAVFGMTLLGYAGTYYELPNPWVALLPAAALGAAPLLVLRAKRQHRLRQFNKYLPEAIDLMGRALRAGHSLTAAIEIVAEECAEPVRSEFREVYRQQNFGLPVRDALLQLANRLPLPEVSFVVTAMLLQRETGGNLVEVLERTTATIRERLRIQGEIRIYTAQGRLTGWILSALPIAMFFLLSVANHGYTRILIEDPTGRKLVYAGISLMVIGGLAIRRIVDVKV